MTGDQLRLPLNPTSPSEETLLFHIKQLLVDSPACRDDDHVLYRWLLTGGYGVNLMETNAWTLLCNISDGVLPQFDSVVRLRRKLQRENEGMRGKLWSVRHSYADVVSAQMVTTS